MAKNWDGIIAAIKKMVADFGEVWPGGSTKLAGYAENGPYHCGDCEYLKGKKEGKIFVDENGRGRCNHEVVIADPEIKKDEEGRKIVNIQTGCCEFVEPLVQIEEEFGGDYRYRPRK